MTKVECPGPGFKGLKWKWIQDHAKEQQEREKEQQEREKERLATQQVQLSGATLPHCPQQQEPVSNSSSDPPQPTDALEQHAGARRQSGGGGVLPQHASGNVQAQPGVKTEASNGLPGFVTSPRTSLTGDVLNTFEERARGAVKEEQDIKAPSAELPATSAAHAAPGGLELGIVSIVQMTMPATGTSVASAGAAAAVSHGVGGSFVGSGVSPTPTMPAVGVPGRKSMDVTASIPAASVSLSPVALTPPLSAVPGPADASHGVGGSVAAATAQVVAPSAAPAATASPFCMMSPPSAPAPALMQFNAAHPASTAPAVQPPGTGPSSAPPLAAGAARVRLPPARGPSMTISTATAKGGDDFESMFTPLLSIPTVKSETPRAGIVSRSSSLLPGPQASLPGAAGGNGPGAATATQHDAGGGERKGPLKKASRMQEGRSNAGQPSTAAAPDLPDGDHGPPARSRTPVAQFNPAAAAPVAVAKDAPASTPAPGALASAKAQSQCQAVSQSNAQGHTAQQQQQQQPPLSQQLQHQQRGSGAKYGKDGTKTREGGEGAVPTGTSTAAEASGTALAVGGGTAVAASRGGAGGDRILASVSAGSTPAAAPAHSGEAGERKRPRSEGSKPKAGTSLTSDPLADMGWPYGETLADRIKRAKRATTSSSDQEGPHSHGGSGERHTSHAAANAPAGDGQIKATGDGTGAREAEEPRPAVSAEAQSRGADAAATSSNPARGVQTAASSGAAVAAAGAGSATAKQQTQQQQQHRLQPPAQGRAKVTGRSDDSPVMPPALFPRSGVPAAAAAAERTLDQLAQIPGSSNMRMSGGGAVTDSSGGGGGPSGAQRASGPPAAGKAAAAGPSAAASAGAKRAAADPPPSSRRHNAPSAKFPRSDPHLPRPQQPHWQDRREGAAAAAGTGSGRGGSALPPPPASKPAHRASSGPPTGRTDGGPGPSDGQGPPTAPGQAPAPAGPPPPPSGRPGRLGESDTPAAGSCKGPVVAGSRGSKDGAGQKGAYGPRHAGGALDAACGGGANGGGGAGAAGTTTTEPKTDSDTRTSRVVECFFEFDQPCRIAGGSASVSGLGSSGSLQGAHGLAARMGGSRFFGGGPAAAVSLLRGGGGATAAAAAQLLDLGKIRSFKELWAQLAVLYDGTLPDEMDSKLIYLDEEGDWIMVTPDEPWSSVAAAATKVLVTNRT